MAACVGHALDHGPVEPVAISSFRKDTRGPLKGCLLCAIAAGAAHIGYDHERADVGARDAKRDIIQHAVGCLDLILAIRAVRLHDPTILPKHAEVKTFDDVRENYERRFAGCRW